jgi:hypothetical protein
VCRIESKPGWSCPFTTRAFLVVSVALDLCLLIGRIIGEAAARAKVIP